MGVQLLPEVRKKAVMGSMCKGKKAYSKLSLAEKVKKRAEHEGGDKLRVYKCWICGKYHLTGEPKCNNYRKPRKKT